MQRRSLLSGLALAGVAAGAGCSNSPLSSAATVDPTFERTDPELSATDPPVVTVDGGTVTVRGTVRYASSVCGSVDLVHAAYEPSQSRLDLFVVAVDDTGDRNGCTDDLATSGYRVTADAPEDLRRVAVTEHHAFGETYSTTFSRSG